MRVGVVWIAFALVFFPALPGMSDENVLRISPEIIQFYNGAYRSLKSPRAIAIADDGFHFGYSYCPEHRCYINPTASNLAMQACTQSGGHGCRVFAVDDDIRVPYEVATFSFRPESVQPVETPTPPAPNCGSKTQTDCAAIVADFDQRRHLIEAQWTAKLVEVEKRWCHNINHRPVHCAQKRSEVESERDAELRALEQEMHVALGL
jgi:hypothetical protein